MNLLRQTLDFVLPPRCPSCRVIVPQDGGFCANCWRHMHFLSPPWCAGCCAPMPFETAGDQHCANCLANPPRHDGIKAAVAYGDVARQVVLKLKYGGKVGLANVIAAQLLRHLPTETKGALIVPVPLHWSRLWSRSYNQSALIAKALVRDHNMIFAPDLLLRTKKTPVLRGMSAAQRKRAVSGAFVINKKWQSQINGAKIILVDDIYTTGATANACVKILKASQAASVQIFCWARVLRGEALEEHNHGDATGSLA